MDMVKIEKIRSRFWGGLVGLIICGFGLSCWAQVDTPEYIIKEHGDYKKPYPLQPVLIPKNREMDFFDGHWAPLRRSFERSSGRLMIEDGKIRYEYLGPVRYRVLRKTAEYIVLVVHRRTHSMAHPWTKQLFLFALRRDPKDGEVLMFHGIRHDMRLDDEPLTESDNYYLRILDTPRLNGLNGELWDPKTAPWGWWGFWALELVDEEDEDLEWKEPPK
jgi:hypothetical protein